MNILYVANVRMPTEKAHGLQIMKTCEAFADLGHSVTLLVSSRKTPIGDDPFDYYGVKRNFELRRAASWDLVRWGRIGFLIQYVTFSFSAARFARTAKALDSVYGRDELSLALISFATRVPIVWESHVGAWNWAARLLSRRIAAFVVISGGLKDFYVERGINAERIAVAHDAVDLEDFADPESKEAARRRLGLPRGKKVALYAGRLDGWKGADTLCEASKFLSETEVAIIGGEESQVASLRARYPSVRFLGYRPYKELRDNLAAADVVVLPNTAKGAISNRFTSPLKLFAYMASGKPIVASDIPSVREILDDRSAFFAKPDDPRSLAQAIEEATENPEAPARAKKARSLVQEYTWEKRARKILLSLDASFEAESA